MMDMREFQKKLGELVAKAAMQDKNLTHEDILSTFGENQLNTQQLQSLYEYLKFQGIRIQGMDLQNMNLDEQVGSVGVAERIFSVVEDVPTPQPIDVPLEMEDEAYYKEYKAYVQEFGQGTKDEREQLLQRYGDGDASVIEKLTQSYQEVILELARNVYQKGVFLADLVQEGNMSLLMINPEEIPARDADMWLQELIVVGMREWIELQAEQKLQDEFMVEQVRKLESAIKELSDDDNQKFSVEELSAYLNMDEDEIRDILNLTGENPEGNE